MASAGNDLHVLAEDGMVMLSVIQPRDLKAEILQTPLRVGTPIPGTVAMRIQCSQENLKRHSSYFCELLQTQEVGTASAADQIEITECDPETFLLAMKIVHGKPHDDSSLELGQLALLAFIVDRYKLHDIMRDFTDSQFNLVESQLFTTGQINNEDLERWLFICWVFSKRQRLNAAVRMAIKTAGYSLSFVTAPNPVHLVEFIEQNRIWAITAIQDSLNARLSTYSWTHASRCIHSLDCDYQQFGALTMFAKITQLNYPPAQPPFIASSVAAILDLVKKFKFPQCPARVSHSFACPNAAAAAPCQCVFDCETGPYLTRLLSEVQDQISRITFL